MTDSKAAFVAVTPYGTFTRRSARPYQFCVARSDGWHQFSMTRQATDKEAAYQNRKGRGAVVVPVKVQP